MAFGTDYTPVGPMPTDIVLGDVDATSMRLARDIRDKGHGIDTRETMARMMLKSSTMHNHLIKVNNAMQVQSDEYYRQYSDVIKELSEEKDYHSLPEIAGARGGFDTLSQHINEKLYKNRGAVTSADLSQEVKEQMTGGSVAVVGKNTILEENIVDKQVTAEKTNFAKKGKNLLDGEYEDLTLLGQASTGYSVGQTEGGRSIFAKVLPNTTYTVSRYDTSNRFTIATFDHEPVIGSIPSRAFDYRDYNSFTLTTSETDMCIMIYTSNQGEEPRVQLELGSESTKYEDYNAVSIDLSDKTLNAVNESLSVTPEKTTFAKKGDKNLLDGKYENLAILGQASLGWSVAQIENVRSILAEVLPNTTYTITRYDTSNRFTIATFDHEPVIGSIPSRAFDHRDYNSFTLTTNETDMYVMIYTSNQGEEPRVQLELGSESTKYEDYNAVSIHLSDETLNEINESLSVTNREMIKLTELRDYTPTNTWLDEHTLWKDSSKMYAFYDNLLASSNGYGEKTIWFNNNETNDPVYLYKFTPPKPQRTDIKYPKILITSLHAYEYLASTVVARWISDVVNNWETNSNLGVFRWNVEIHIAPIINTHGYNNAVRTNENGVELNRNFGTSGWEAGGEGTDYYAGPTPNSEKQNQKVIELVENGDYDFVIDAHTYNTLASDGNALWVGYTEPRILPRLSSWANKVNADLKANHDGDVTKSNDHLIFTRKGNSLGRFLVWLDENGHDGAIFEMVYSIGTTREDLQTFLVKSFGELLNTVINHVLDV